MGRKTGTLEDQRNAIKREYKHGARGNRDLVNFDKLSNVERALKRQSACYLKAAGFSFKYISEAIGVPRSTIQEWFREPSMQAELVSIQDDFTQGAVKLLKTYAVELIEMLVNIARDGKEDTKIRLQAILEALDRSGLSKVNKSESAATITKKQEIDLTDKRGLVDAMKDAPTPVQHEMAEKIDELLALAAEHTDENVTQGVDVHA